MPPRAALLERLVATVPEEVLDGAVVDGPLLRAGVHDPCVRRRVVRQVQSDRHGPMLVCSFLRRHPLFLLRPAFSCSAWFRPEMLCSAGGSVRPSLVVLALIAGFLRHYS